MSALTDRIAAEHGVMSSGADGPYCGSCGALIPAPDGNYTIGHARHIATATEAAVREQVADAISATVITRDDQRRILNSGYGMEWVNGYIRGVTDAARIARGGVA